MLSLCEGAASVRNSSFEKVSGAKRQRSGREMAEVLKEGGRIIVARVAEIKDKTLVLQANQQELKGDRKLLMWKREDG